MYICIHLQCLLLLEFTCQCGIQKPLKELATKLARLFYSCSDPGHTCVGEQTRELDISVHMPNNTDHLSLFSLIVIFVSCQTSSPSYNTIITISLLLGFFHFVVLRSILSLASSSKTSTFGLCS